MKSLTCYINIIVKKTLNMLYNYDDYKSVCMHSVTMVTRNNANTCNF